MRTTKINDRLTSGLGVCLFTYYKFRKTGFKGLHSTFILVVLMMAGSGLKAQVSGGWDSFTGNGIPGNNNYGNGVIRLISDENTGCAAGAVHETSSTYDPGSGNTFNKCYQVFFGCPGNDEIGSDANGDGMAFSFWKNSASYNINNGSACGGGLGYMGAATDGKMITIEFDTYSSAFDGTYGGGASGNNDEISVHINGDAGTSGLAAGGTINAGNLEDGLEHTICISYTPGTHILKVTIDGVTKLNYDLGPSNNLLTYFGAGGLNQTWSSGKFGASNPTTVNDGNGTTIVSQLGGVVLCPATVVITSPLGGTSFGSCQGPITITAVASPPAGNTIDSVEFFVGAIKIGVDNTEDYSIIWNNPSEGNHDLTAVAHYKPSGSFSTSSEINITVGGGIELTTTAPVIDGTIDAVWANYATASLNKVPWGTISGPADASATYRTMRDAINLYILVEVIDDDLRNDDGPVFENDGVEIFIDMGNNKATDYVPGANDYQYAFGYNSAVITEYKNSPGSLTGVTFSQGVKTGGYIIEIKIPWSTIGTAPVDDELIGFDVHVNDDDGGGTRDGKIAWHDAVDDAHAHPYGMGTTTASACNPCPTGTLSGSKILCNDGISSADISVDFTGVGPWSITYTKEGILQPSITGITINPFVFQSNNEAATYELTSVANTQTSGCTNNYTGTVTIGLSDFPIGHDGTFTPPANAVLSVDNAGATYEWYDAPVGGNLVFTGVEFTIAGLTDTARYYVQETPGASCRTEVKAIPLKEFFIPNLITPNSDGKNDRFEIVALPNGTELKLFNRWGSAVYQSSNYDNLWAGNDNSEGIYYFDLTLPNGKQYKGWLNVVK